jgi:hypothetical protein
MPPGAGGAQAATVSGTVVEERHAPSGCAEATDPMTSPAVTLVSVSAASTLVLLPDWLAAFSLSSEPASRALNVRRKSNGSTNSSNGIVADECCGHGSRIQVMLLLLDPGPYLFPGCKAAQQLKRRAEMSPEGLGRIAFHSKGTEWVHTFSWSVKDIDAAMALQTLAQGSSGETLPCSQNGSSRRDAGYMRR